ncbi:MAG: molecular chaperone HtpG [Ardenticatenia bacterium]|nr:molecular chaperone HtpG [Ardenticatenia bacterium]
MAQVQEPAVEQHEFRAEVRQLLDILARSLYTEREIFLRELISNASDALNRLQFEMLTTQEVLDPEAELAIRIQADKEQRTVTVSDTGIGMTREELLQNLGTIAHSGARTFLRQLQEGQISPERIIGQFGVGFYSVFMVAEEVTVTTRSYRPDAQAWSWTSRGDGTYTVAPTQKAERGTTVTVKLKEEAAEFADEWRLEQIVRRHSNYISFPIYVGERVVNRQVALWRQMPSEVQEEDYIQFYRELTLDTEKPLLWLHIVTDAPVNIRSILYVPSRREWGLLPGLRSEYGLRLYSRQVLIQEHTSDLLPAHFRFVEGVVDSEDVPLNVSREAVQQDPMLRHIRRALTARLVKELKALAEQDPDRYATFWREFGPFLKEGVATDPSSHDDLKDLLRFHSSHAEGDGLVSLAAYVARMKPDQKAIYYVVGDDLTSVRHSPHLDPFRSQQVEVLYLVEPVDTFAVLALREYEGYPFRNVEDADIEALRVEVPHDEEADAPFQALVERVRAILGDRVADVRASQHLITSPCRLVAPESGPERELARVRRLLDQEFEVPKRILELNPRHTLVRHLATMQATTPDDPLLPMIVEQLFENALLVEGLLPNPAAMTPRIQALMEAAVNARVQTPTTHQEDTP